MDIEFESTPPKKSNPAEQFSTPPKKGSRRIDETPVKSKVVRFVTPIKQFGSGADFSTPSKKKGENPESRKLQSKSRTLSPVEWLSSAKRISSFKLSRLEADYEFMRYLGSGNFSSVGLYKSRMTEELFAIKISELSLMSVNQVQALGSMSIFSEKTNHIIKYYHSWTESDSLHIVMEYCESSLTSFYSHSKLLQSQGGIPEEQLKSFLRQSVEGLNCMHRHGMVHLDIKPDNLLLKNGSVKISDLGLCRVSRIKRWSELDEGDSRYLAKEVLNYREGIDLTKADIFSLGMSIFQGCVLESLPNNGEQWLQVREQGLNMSEIPQMSQYSQQFKQVLQKMTKPNWYDRPSCSQLLQMEYFQRKENNKNHHFHLQHSNKRLSKLLKNSKVTKVRRESSL